ncbi:hypothetical protein BOTBODRAFT_32415 [Botryobasidium botryosum FD-172 SS1]|uniref:Uncharacterized protein n=1 Tax=Botryobasidium botryosum (strain FD-172 SS1) TaxID=930990 RepID=A0A067MIV7_BOTB1|nr:hypothetical protein BOTBODRAFT_32415 [Botryobasidium botryosum FD-172 SS1]
METPILQFETLFKEHQRRAYIRFDSHSHQDRASWKETQASLDGELDVVHQILEAAAWLLSEIRSRRNQLSPIHHLPNELLSAIFEHARYDAGDPTVYLHSSQLDTRKPIQALLKISGVSRLWRDIIRGCPALWAALPPPSAPELLEIFLARSKTAPLEIASSIAATQPCSLPRYRALLLPHFGRLRVCVLAFSQNLGADDISALLASAPAPELERCELYRGKGMEYQGLASNKLRLSCPPFIDCTPKLCHLRLEEVGVPLNALVFRELVSLHLFYTEYTAPGSLHQLLCILELSPRLSELRFGGLKFPVLEPTNHPPNAIVKLPCLQVLCMSARVPKNDWILYLLSHIEIPATCQSWIRGKIKPGSDLCQLLPSSSPISVHINQLDFQFGRRDTSWNTVGGYISGQTHRAVAAVFQGNREDTELIQRVVLNLDSVLPMPLLDSIILSSQIDVMEPALILALAEFLRSHPTIDAITLVDSAVQLLELLVVTPGRILCPLLDTLYLEGDDGNSEPVGESMLLEVVKSRTNRDDSGVPEHLQHVTYTRSKPLSPLTTSALRELVTLELESDLESETSD